MARRYGVARQTVHEWLRRYAKGGLAALIDQSSRPLSCPHQMPAVTEARIVELRRAHPGWGPRTIGHQLGREGVDPVPGRSSIYRCAAECQAGPAVQKRCRVGSHDLRRQPVSVAPGGWSIPSPQGTSS
jgi:transposase-like protein